MQYQKVKIKKLDGSKIRIGVVCSRFNEEITNGLLAECKRGLKFHGVKKFKIWRVPGSLEIPLLTMKLAQSGKYDALIALGAVIRGETDHYQYVSEGAFSGIMAVLMMTGIPMGVGILTCDSLKQAKARLKKGFECVEVAIEMSKNIKEVNN